MIHRFLHYVGMYASILMIAGCGGGGNDSPTNNSPTYEIQLEFSRIDSAGLDPIQVSVSVFEDSNPKTGIANDLVITLGLGSAGVVTESAPGVYDFVITPSQTGEHPVTVEYNSVSVSRTPLVLAFVDTGWEQPMSVPGLVNSEGYEDGITISPDGEYLYVQYGPVYFSAFHMFAAPRSSGGCEGNRLFDPMNNPDRCTHQWLDNSIGPYTAPERPGFFDGRISGTTLLHNAASWGVGIDQAIIYAPSTMFYGFKRQADGRFAEPFYIAFDDVNDGIINPFGMSFHTFNNGTTTMLFSMDDPANTDMVDTDNDGTADVESNADVYAIDISPGQNTILGTYVASGVAGTPPVRSTPFDASLVNFGKTGFNGIYGLQGNPHLHVVNDQVRSIWTDDERDNDADTGEIAVYVLNSGDLANGNWTKQLLPTNVNVPGSSHEVQPFFTGNGLYFTRSTDVSLPEIFYSTYSGSHDQTNLANNNNWTSATKILGLGNTNGIGKVTAIGEPTIATFNGEEYLYFVYAIIRGYENGVGAVGVYPDINMQAGFIKKR